MEESFLRERVKNPLDFTPTNSRKEIETDWEKES